MRLSQRKGKLKKSTKTRMRKGVTLRRLEIEMEELRRKKRRRGKL